MVRLFGKGSNHNEGLESLRKRANDGDLQACIELGEYYYSDDIENFEEAEKWFLAAFDMRPDAKTAYRIGYCKGRDSIIDSYEWLEKSEKMGYEDATAALDDICADPKMLFGYTLENDPISGIEMDESCVEHSIEKGYPFWADNKYEEDKFGTQDAISPPLFVEEDGKYALTTYPSVLEDFLMRYSQPRETTGHPLKLRYMLSVLRTRAEKGDQRAKAVLASNACVRQGLIDRGTAEEYRIAIEDAANAGDPDALFAKGYLAAPRSGERWDTLLASARKGNADAAYMLRWDGVCAYEQKFGEFPPYEAEKKLFELAASGEYGVTLEYMRKTLAEDFTDVDDGAVIPLSGFAEAYE